MERKSVHLKNSLEKYPEMRERMYKLLNEGEKITPKQWRQEIKTLQAEYDSIGREQNKMQSRGKRRKEEI